MMHDRGAVKKSSRFRNRQREAGKGLTAEELIPLPGGRGVRDAG